MKTSCQAHCRSCDRHFAGVTAFELHRANFECLDPEDVEGLFAYKNKPCHIRDAKPQKRVVVWSTVGPT